MKHQGHHVFAVVMLSLALGLLTGCSRQESTPPAAVETIVIGGEIGLLSSALWVAESKGYFRAQRLEVKVVPFDSGRLALKAMLEQGGLDMVTAAQTPVMFSSFTRSDYAIIGGMVTAPDDIKVLARRDAGIARVTDLQRKRVGVTKGSAGHYFLSALLRAHGLRLTDVEVLDTKAGELPQALADAKVAAISTWEPHGAKARKLLGANALPFDSHGIFREDFYFVANRGFIERHPEALKRFLKAIDQATGDIVRNPAEAIGIVAARLHLDRAAVEELWNIYSFKLFLDQTILLTLEDQARWAIENGLAEGRTVPNYLKFIHPDALVAVKPAAVTLIR